MTTYKKTLDKSRDYGTQHPPEFGVFYFQDGYPFDQDGKIVEAMLTDPQKEALAKKVSAAVAAKPPAPAVTKGKAPAVEPKPESDTEPKEQTEPEGTEDGLNLTAWLKGEESYPFPEIQKAVKARFNVWKTGKRDLVLFLVEDQKLVEAGELSAEFKSAVG